jgi:hypothetical protein
MLNPKHQIEVFEGKRGGHYWRARHIATQRIVADGSEPYSTASNARRAARRIGRSLIFAPVVTVEDNHGR